MVLDINTPLGVQSVEHERRAIQIISASYRRHRVIHTPIESPASIDGVVEAGGVLAAIFESKCRNMSADELAGRFGNEWIMSLDKIITGASISKHLRVPMVGFLYLIPDDFVMSVRITDNEGRVIAPMRIAFTNTRASINGGAVSRSNAYIKMDGAKIIRKEDKDG